MSHDRTDDPSRVHEIDPTKERTHNKQTTDNEPSGAGALISDTPDYELKPCSLHPEFMYHMYCRDCKDLLCKICMEAHTGHEMCDISTAMSERRKEIAEELQVMHARRKEAERQHNELQETRKRYLQGVKEAEEAMERRANEIHKMLDKALRQRLVSLHQMHQMQLATAENQENQLQAQYSRVDEVVSQCRDEIEKRDSVSLAEFLQTSPELAELDELSKIPELEPIVAPTYIPPEIDREAIREMFGTLHVPNPTDLDDNQSDRKENFRQTDDPNQTGRNDNQRDPV